MERFTTLAAIVSTVLLLQIFFSNAMSGSDEILEFSRVHGQRKVEFGNDMVLSPEKSDVLSFPKTVTSCIPGGKLVSNADDYGKGPSTEEKPCSNVIPDNNGQSDIRSINGQGKVEFGNDMVLTEDNRDVLNNPKTVTYFTPGRKLLSNVGDREKIPSPAKEPRSNVNPDIKGQSASREKNETVYHVNGHVNGSISEPSPGY